MKILDVFNSCKLSKIIFQILIYLNLVKKFFKDSNSRIPKTQKNNQRTKTPHLNRKQIVRKTNKKGGNKKEGNLPKPSKNLPKGVLEGCLLFSFLLFCFFSHDLFSVEVWCFCPLVVFLCFGDSTVRVLEKFFNCAFVWTLRGVRVSGDTASGLLS